MMKGGVGDKGYEAYGEYGDYQGDAWKRKSYTLGGEEKPPSKRLRVKLVNEAPKADCPREGALPGKISGRDGGMAVGDERKGRGEVGEDGRGKKDRDGTEDGDGAEEEEDDDEGDDSESDEGC